VKKCRTSGLGEEPLFRPATFAAYDPRMQQAPKPDSSEFAALMDFVATSGRTLSHPTIAAHADQLAAQMLAGRARAMTLSLAALARAAVGRNA